MAGIRDSCYFQPHVLPIGSPIGHLQISQSWEHFFSLFRSCFFSNVTHQLFPSKNQALVIPTAKLGKSYPPVIMVIFDEIALFSLLGSDGKIDATHFPGFARVAKDASWFKGAPTVADNILDVVPAIITGRYPEDTERKATEKNDNIFTL